MNTKLFLAGASFLTLAGTVFGGSDIQKWTEKRAIAVLAIDNQTRAEACQALAVIGGPDSVPALSWLLDDPQLAAYARTALEVIDHPSAGQALIDAMDRLEGPMLIGVITSLGERREEKALPAIKALATNKKRGAIEASMVALARIGTDDALSALTANLGDESKEIRVHAAHATLLAADIQAKKGNSRVANNLMKAVRQADLPDHIKKAATS